MKKSKVLVILALIVIIAVAGCQKPESLRLQATPRTIPAGAKLVCLFFDDCWQNQHDVALPILLQYGFKATFGVITGSIGTGTGIYKYMGKPELKGLAEYGMDIACHSKTHPHFIADLSAEQIHEQASETYKFEGKTREGLIDERLRAEIIDSKKYLEGLGFKVRTFVYPYYEYEDSVIGYVKEAGYVCARSGGRERATYDLRTNDVGARYHVPSYAIISQNLEQFKLIVVQAGRYSVVCLIYHHISDIGPAETSTPVANFAEQMRYLKETGFTVALLPDLFE